MYNLLIVEDEELERMALKSMITNLFDDICVIGEAKNGKEAIEQADRLHPDIITMDIKLPGMNGLQTIEEIQVNHPYVSFIVLSAFDTFSYAQKAMSLQVNHYLLKPYNQRELMDTLTKICIERDKKQKARMEKIKMKDGQEHIKALAEIEWVSTIIHNQIHDITMEELNNLAGATFDEGISAIVQFHAENCFIFTGKIKATLYQQVKAIVKQDNDCLMGPMINDHIPLFFLKNKKTERNSIRYIAVMRLKRLFIQLSKVGHQFDNLFITASVGNAKYSIYDLQTSYHEALAASGYERERKRIQFYEDMEKEQPLVVDTFQHEKKLLDFMRNQNEYESLKMVETIINEQYIIYDGDIEPIKAYLNELFILISRLSERVIDRRKTHFSPFISIDQLRSATKQWLHETMSELEDQQKDNSILERIQGYIFEHYKGDLTLESAAAQVNLSPSYFSKIFKEASGQNFIDYLSMVRIDKAKILLTQTNLSLKEICFEIGYHDPNYFSRVFKKYEGVSPRNFRMKKK